VTVPDILACNIVEACGMNTRGERNQVINVSGSKFHSTREYYIKYT